ncbi:hypothetical protein, partial [Klebsiella pneumoniae]|uniref:hypothetical protein n=1 Tax=Klebsiella pneumoniae TaxID=573 RepID=UPI003EE2F99B
KKANEHKTRKKEQEAARNTPEYKVDLATKRMIALQKELDIQKAKLADPKFEVMKPIIQRDITFYENQLAIAEKQLAKLVLR